MMTLFEQEYAVERYGDEQRAEGETRKAREMAVSFADIGSPVEKIAEAAKVSVAKVKEWISDSITMAKQKIIM